MRPVSRQNKRVPFLSHVEDFRYLNPPTSWQKAELESKELLAFCIKRIKGLNKVKLVDAGTMSGATYSHILSVEKGVFLLNNFEN